MFQNRTPATETLARVLRPHSKIPGYWGEYWDCTFLCPKFGYSVEVGPSEHERRESEYLGTSPARHTLEMVGVLLIGAPVFKTRYCMGKNAAVMPVAAGRCGLESTLNVHVDIFLQLLTTLWCEGKKSLDFGSLFRPIQ